MWQAIERFRAKKTCTKPLGGRFAVGRFNPNLPLYRFGVDTPKRSGQPQTCLQQALNLQTVSIEKLKPYSLVHF